MQCQDSHIGNQLHVSSAMAGEALGPISPGLRDPVCLGFGAASIPGSIYANGVVLIGSPLAYPAPGESTLMVARQNPKINPKAVTGSIFKVSNRASVVPPTPIDVMIGDPTGPVGMSLFTASINIIETTSINIISPIRTSAGVKKHAGASSRTGAEVDTGAETHTGVNVNNAVTIDNKTRKINGVTITPLVKGKIFTGKALKDKGFDIEHPTRKGKRVRHICVEGPESAIYIRGKLKGMHIIDIPEYWQGLVDYDTITVNLTPCGKPDLSLYVKEIRDNKIILSSDHLTQVECFYHVWGNRIGPELHVEYDGESPADYPGDQSGHSIAGYTYDKEEA
jgi:hypothetical protein